MPVSECGARVMHVNRPVKHNSVKSRALSADYDDCEIDDAATVECNIGIVVRNRLPTPRRIA